MNNNLWENIKYLLVIVLLIVVMIFTITARFDRKQTIEFNCDCIEKATEIIDKKLTTFIEMYVEQLDEDLSDNGEDDTPYSNITEQNARLDQTVTNYQPQNFEICEAVPLPTLPTNIKTYTDYRHYNLWYTPHYRLQQAAYTDENGLRRFNDDYIVALGKFYSESIGDRFKVTLDTGREFTVIFGDGKAPVDCDENNMYTPCRNYDGEKCANVLEFIIDSDVMAKEVYAYGSIDCIEEFKGNIVKMEYLGRDNSADWDTYETR